MKLLQVFLTTTLLILFSYFGYSQNGPYETGIYQSSADYLNNNKISHYRHVKTYDFPRKIVFFEDSLGNEIKYKIRRDSIWGYKSMFGNVVRLINNKSWVILAVGTIYVYGEFAYFYSGEYVALPNINPPTHNIGSTPMGGTGVPKAYISLGINGKLIKGNRTNLLTLLKKNGEDITKYDIPRLYYKTLIEWVNNYNLLQYSVLQQNIIKNITDIVYIGLSKDLYNKKEKSFIKLDITGNEKKQFLNYLIKRGIKSFNTVSEIK